MAIMDRTAISIAESLDPKHRLSYAPTQRYRAVRAECSCGWRGTATSSFGPGRLEPQHPARVEWQTHRRIALFGDDV